MPTLIIPDIHERLDKLANALSGRIERADRVIFLGDFFDAFGKTDLTRMRDVCRFINKNIDGIRWEDGDIGSRIIPVDFLLGNHDCHYFFGHDGFKCSGYNHQKQDVIDTLIPRTVREKFHIFTRVGSYLLSHAGFHTGNIGNATPEVERHHLQIAHDGGFSRMWGAGMARGGNQALGGPTWLDFAYEFEPIVGVPQIVGHTNGKDVRTKQTSNGEISYCIDTALHNICWISDDGQTTIEPI